MRRDALGQVLVPGYNVDRVNVAAGIRLAKQFGYTSAEHLWVIDYALVRWARAEEDGAERTALSGGIDFTSWRCILAAGLAGAASPEQLATLTNELLGTPVAPIAHAPTAAPAPQRKVAP